MSRFKVNDMIDSIVDDYREQVRKALKRAEQKIKVRMQEIIQQDMIDDYYQGYKPKMYVRINQLKKSVGPYTSLKDASNVFSLGFGIETDEPYGPTAMDHSKLMVRVNYNRKKKGGTWSRLYVYEDEDVDEESIFENFLDGIHPNVGRENTHNIRAKIKQQLNQFLDVEIMDIVNRELDKIK
jgi:hypothetical protein